MLSTEPLPRDIPANGDEFELMRDSIIRDLIDRVQSMRKSAGLIPAEEVGVQYAVVSNPDNTDLDNIISSSSIDSSVHGTFESLSSFEEIADPLSVSEDHNIGSLTLTPSLARL